MIFFDSHCHINARHFDADREEVISRAADAGIRMLVIGTDAESSRFCCEIADKYDSVYAAVGIHPNDSAEATDNDFETLRELATHKKVVAVGETGLDFFHDHSDRGIQVKVFHKHLEIAQEFQLPVVIHARDSAQECLDIIEPFMHAGGRAVWHCFIAGKRVIADLMERAIGMGLYLGITGLVTFEDQIPLRRIVTQIPDKHLLLDTDSPYLIPRPRTVDRNEPIQCIRIAEELATLRGVSLTDIARITTRNACELLGLQIDEQNNTNIAYPIRDSLYINLTSRCTNHCTFCARNQSLVVKGHDISLQHEPDASEVIDALGDFRKYKEIVFCGYGEPTMCLDVLLAVARYLKNNGQKIRLNTNGLANLYFHRDIVPELTGLIDSVSISLNTADPQQYQELCQSDFGLQAHQALQDFASSCIKHGIDTTLTVVEMPGIDVNAAQELTQSIGAKFRVRSFVDAG